MSNVEWVAAKVLADVVLECRSGVRTMTAKQIAEKARRKLRVMGVDCDIDENGNLVNPRNVSYGDEGSAD